MGERLGKYKPLIPECLQASLEGISGSEKQPSLPELVAGEKDLGTVTGGLWCGWEPKLALPSACYHLKPSEGRRQFAQPFGCVTTCIF